MPGWCTFVVAIACGCAAVDSPAPSASATAGTSAAGVGDASKVCNGGFFRCFARARFGAALPRPLDTVPGYGPPDLQSAYNLDVATSVDATIALVEAYGYANLESDLATYRAQFGLPACTVASGCLTIVNQEGATSPLPGPPPTNDDWTQEGALDVQMASAACPSCKLLVVEADNDTGSGLYEANAVAASHGASVISNSWGTPEARFGGDLPESYFDHAGIAIFASTGDEGFEDGGAGTNYPASSAYVFGVGGTTLVRDATALRGWTEAAWSFGGAGCSTAVSTPSWQVIDHCSKRAISDLAAIGDPALGVAVYNQAAGGWGVVGGTSAASPLVAAMFAQTGNAAATPQYAYTHSFFDVTSGGDGSCGDVLCQARVGWDGPTGNGTPNGAVLLGATAPTLVVDGPSATASVPLGFTVSIECTPTDATTILEVDVTIDNEPLGKLTSAPYTYTSPASLAYGPHTIAVTCSTTSLAQASQAFAVTIVTAPCTTTTDCSDANGVCYNGACIAGPDAAGGLGATCTTNSDCASGSCASDGTSSHCTVTCDPDGTACPSGFTCIGAGTTNVCWPSSSHQGGCSVDDGGPVWLAAIALVALRARRRPLRRCRSACSRS